MKKLNYKLDMWGSFLMAMLTNQPFLIVIFAVAGITYGILSLSEEQKENNNA
jgi:hypothetical protein